MIDTKPPIGNWYVKKAIPVTAIQWSQKKFHPLVEVELETGRCFIPTIENQRLYLTEGCWIVGPGAKGEYWPVDEQVFAMTYELVDTSHG